MSRLLAAIDVGSNAARLFIARAQEQQGVLQIQKQNFLRVPLRLGMDVYSHGSVSDERGRMFLHTMKSFSNLLKVYRPEAYQACATAAIREAANGDRWLKKIKKATDLEIKIIDGLEEARLIRSTVAMKSDGDGHLTMFVDVGGGSTEISVLEGNKLLDQRSFNIGTLRMLHGKHIRRVWTEMKQWLSQFSHAYGNIQLIGSGGNINKLVKLFGKPKEMQISYDPLNHASQQMRKISVKERMSIYRLREDRADVIVPASKIFLFIMETIKARQVTAPKIGVADGLIVELYHAIKNGKKLVD